MLEDSRYMTGKNEKQIGQGCRTCVRYKQVRSPAKRKLVERSNNVTVHEDTCGPMPLTRIGGSYYFMTMTTAKHRYTRLKITKSRKKVAGHIMDFITWFDQNSREYMKRMQNNNAKKFLYLSKE